MSSPPSQTMDFEVAETFMTLPVADMDRAIKFYAASLCAVTKWTSPRWSSLKIAGVRIGLFADPEYRGGRVGLHFVVSDIERASSAIQRAGGSVAKPEHEVAPGVLVLEVADTEGNIFSLQAGSS